MDKMVFYEYYQYSMILHRLLKYSINLIKFVNFLFIYDFLYLIVIHYFPYFSNFIVYLI